MTIFPLCYFAPIPWYAAALQAENIGIEVAEHYAKQQYTNRLWIKTTNGDLPLIIPVLRTGERKAIRDKRISYESLWQKNHWKSLETAYRSSPYFEYYEDKFAVFYEKKYEFLIDFTLEIQAICFQLLQIETPVQQIETYEKPGFYAQDYRAAFDASRHQQPEWFVPVPYTQVFEGFSAGLSIFDLLCNEGPHSRDILKKSVLSHADFRR